MDQADWTIEKIDGFERSAKPWLKRYRRELLQTLENLDSLVGALRAGALTQQARQAYGFIHSEPDGIIAIDQKGAGPHTKESRLYVWIDGIEQTVFVLRIGDKRSQQGDIAYCRKWLESRRVFKRNKSPPYE